MPAPSTNDPEERSPGGIGRDLGTVFRGLATAAAAAVTELPSGLRSYAVLDAVAASELPPSQQALAQRLGVDRSAMTYLLDALERDDLVQRQRDPADRRAHHVTTTPKGRALLVALRGRLDAAERALLEPLDSGQQQQFRDLLRRLAEGSAGTAACDDGSQPGAIAPARPGPATACPDDA